MFTLQVRMSPDMLTAYVLWSGHPECEDAAQHELQSRYTFVLPKRLPVDASQAQQQIFCHKLIAF